MQTALRPNLTLVFTIFSMFFGSGNAIFPIELGVHHGNGVIAAIFGLGATAIVLPFAGLTAITLYHGNLQAFLNQAGKTPARLLAVTLVLTLGPLVTLPRCVSVAHASLIPYFPNLSLFWFSWLFCFLAWCCVIRPHHMNTLLGRILSPLLTSCLFAIITLGLWYRQTPTANGVNNLDAFTTGFVTGYGTLDLLAALFFGPTIWNLQPSHTTTQERIGQIIVSSLYSFLILAFIYSGLAYVGSSFPELRHTESVFLLAELAQKTLGPFGGMVANFAVVLACLTTIIGLTLSLGSFRPQRTLLTPTRYYSAVLLLTAVVAPVGFSQIMIFLTPTLKVVYPAVIVLAFASMLQPKLPHPIIKTPTIGAFILAGLAYYWHWTP